MSLASDTELMSLCAMAVGTDLLSSLTLGGRSDRWAVMDVEVGTNETSHWTPHCKAQLSSLGRGRHSRVHDLSGRNAQFFISTCMNIAMITSSVYAFSKGWRVNSSVRCPGGLSYRNRPFSCSRYLSGPWGPRSAHL